MADRTFAKAKSWPELHEAHARWACMGMSAPPCTRAVGYESTRPLDAYVTRR
jgi:hypothetical protein